MPIIAETSVVPQALSELAKELRKILMNSQTEQK